MLRLKKSGVIISTPQTRPVTASQQNSNVRALTKYQDQSIEEDNSNLTYLELQLLFTSIVGEPETLREKYLDVSAQNIAKERVINRIGKQLAELKMERHKLQSDSTMGNIE